MRDIAEHIAKALAEGRDTVLVTVVDCQGSAPRHAGSQMLVDAGGLACGTIGGGALEAHAIAEGRGMLASGENRFEHVDLVADLGMGCGGETSLVYASVRGDDAAWKQVAAEALRRLDARIPANLALRCGKDGQPPATGVALLDVSGQVVAGGAAVSTCGGEASSRYAIAANSVDAKRRAASISPGESLAVDGGAASINPDGAAIAGCEASARQPPCDFRAPRFAGDWFILPLALPVRAVVFGGGHVGRATVEALSRVGFACTLFDSRPEFARPEDFPGAQEVICGDFDDIAACITLDKRDFVLIMTPGHRSDFAVLEQVLRRPSAYVGLIGSRRKIAQGRRQMLESGIPQAAIDAVHMPIGLAIGAETPEEIAVSIAAECIRERAAR